MNAWKLPSHGTPAWNDLIASLASLMRKGGLALLPAEGLYGLHVAVPWPPAAEPPAPPGAPGEPEAVQRLRVIKASPHHRPFISLIGDVGHVRRLVSPVPALAQRLTERAWPGPLTLILPARGDYGTHICQKGLVALRCPGSVLLRELAGQLDGLLLSTSANPAGQPPPADLRAVAAEVREAVDAVVEGGHLMGKPSTLVQSTRDDELTLVRPGLWLPTDEERGWFTA
jgi:L-threonylcarbamoyladenylate synthase